LLLKHMPVLAIRLVQALNPSGAGFDWLLQNCAAPQSPSAPHWHLLLAGHVDPAPKAH
jgi:hypothetical protein